MKKIFIVIILFLIFGCNDNHECCSHTQYEQERQMYSNSLSEEQLLEYEKCKKEYRAACYGKCYNPGMNPVFAERCTEDCIYHGCSGR